MTTWPASGLRHNIKAKYAQLQCVNEGINRANRIVLADMVIQPFRK